MRYVCNELTETERTAFEEQLATDETACLAVAEAVRITAGLNSSAMTPAALPAGPQPISRRRTAAAAACCAATLIAGFVFWNNPARHQTASMQLASAELVSRWTADDTESLFDELAGDDDFDPEFEMADDHLSAPDWLLTAVKLRDKESDQPGDPRIQDENL